MGVQRISEIFNIINFFIGELNDHITFVQARGGGWAAGRNAGEKHALNSSAVFGDDAEIDAIIAPLASRKC